jgi:hypothetical protein
MKIFRSLIASVAGNLGFAGQLRAHMTREVGIDLSEKHFTARSEFLSLLLRHDKL